MKKILAFNINADILKLFALFAMTVDHIGMVFGVWEWGGRILIGRSVLPIFVFLMVNHLSKNQNFDKYIGRLLLFGVLTGAVLNPFEPFYMPFNIFFTLLLPVVFLKMYKDIEKEITYFPARLILSSCLFFIFLSLASFTSYVWAGFLFVISFYQYVQKQDRFHLALLMATALILNWQTFALADLPWGISSMVWTFFLTRVTLDKNGKRFLRPWWLFYAYFPIHLYVLYSLKALL